jgi:hypothetical protein
MLQTLYEDDTYKILYGVAKKGCSSIERAPKLIAINKELGQLANIEDVPSVILDAANQKRRQMDAHR